MATRNTIIKLTGVCLLFVTSSVWAHCGGKHGPDHPHCAGGGQEDPVFNASSLDPDIPPINSYSLDNGDQIVFRNADIDLGQFTGQFPDGTLCDHGWSHGTMVLKPKSSNNPSLAVLTFYFQGVLDSGKTTTHLLYMEGDDGFDDLSDWPPAGTTTVTLDYWEVAAENKKSQRSDCAGVSGSTAGPWIVSVTRQ